MIRPEEALHANPSFLGILREIHSEKTDKNQIVLNGIDLNTNNPQESYQSPVLVYKPPDPESKEKRPVNYSSLKEIAKLKLPVMITYFSNDSRDPRTTEAIIVSTSKKALKNFQPRLT